MFDFLFDWKLTPAERIKKNPRKYISKEAFRVMKKNDYAYVEVEGKETVWSVIFDKSFIFGTSVHDKIAEERVRKECNVRYAKNPDGSIKTTMMRPFGGEFGHEPREYPVLLCDAIPLGIRSILPIEGASDDLIDAIVVDPETFLEKVKEQSKKSEEVRG